MDIFIRSAVGSNRYAPITGLIQKNPQMEHNHIRGIILASDIRKAISKYSMQLTKLQIILQDDNNEHFSFGNVVLSCRRNFEL